jgi:hypothetical protein
VKNISSALDNENLQYRKLISTAAAFCATNITAMLPSISISVSLKFIFHTFSCGLSNAFGWAGGINDFI